MSSSARHRRASFSASGAGGAGYGGPLPSLSSSTATPFNGTLPPLRSIQAPGYPSPHHPQQQQQQQQHHHQYHNHPGQQPPSSAANPPGPPPSAAPAAPTAKMACVPCRNRHIACDHNRPCRRCFLSGRPELCRDEPKKKRGSTDGSNMSPSSGAPEAAPMMYPSARSSMSHSTGYSGHARSNSVSSPDMVGTIVLSTSMRVARVSDEVCDLLKVVPGTLLQQPFVEFIHREDRSMFGELIVDVLQHPLIPSCPVPVPQDVLYQIPLSHITQKVEGTAQKNATFRLKGGRKSFAEMNFCVYLSNAFGGDITRPETYKCMCLVLQIQLTPEGAAGITSSRRSRTNSTLGTSKASPNPSMMAPRPQPPSGHPSYPSPAPGGRSRRTLSSFDTSAASQAGYAPPPPPHPSNYPPPSGSGYYPSKQRPSSVYYR